MGVVQWGFVGVVFLQIVRAGELSYFQYGGEDYLCQPQRYGTVRGKPSRKNPCYISRFDGNLRHHGGNYRVFHSCGVALDV
eukprot:1005980-Pyramimonas_sp.AAC.2